MNKKYFFFDMDGSLMTSSDEMKTTDENLKYIEKIKSRGDYVGACTGRHYAFAKEGIDYCGIESGITSGGARVDMDGKTIKIKRIETKDFVDQLLDTGKIETVNMCLLDGTYVKLKEKGYKKYDDVLQASFVTEKGWDQSEEFKVLLNELRKKHHVFGWETGPQGDNDIFWEIHHITIDKMNAIKSFMDAKGISVDDVYFLGDGDNDLEAMLGLKNTFAPANANERVKKLVRHQLKNSNKEGCLKEMYNIIYGTDE